MTMEAIQIRFAVITPGELNNQIEFAVDDDCCIWNFLKAKVAVPAPQEVFADPQ